MTTTEPPPPLLPTDSSGVVGGHDSCYILGGLGPGWRGESGYTWHALRLMGGCRKGGGEGGGWDIGLYLDYLESGEEKVEDETGTGGRGVRVYGGGRGESSCSLHALMLVECKLMAGNKF